MTHWRLGLTEQSVSRVLRGYLNHEYLEIRQSQVLTDSCNQLIHPGSLLDHSTNRAGEVAFQANPRWIAPRWVCCDDRLSDDGFPLLHFERDDIDRLIG